MSNDVVIAPGSSVTNRLARAQLDQKATRVTLYVKSRHFGLVSTGLRVFDTTSLDAVYRVVESHALGTLSWKHYWFCLENEAGIISACVCHAVALKGGGKGSFTIKGSFARRRSLDGLMSYLKNPISEQNLAVLFGFNSQVS